MVLHRVIGSAPTSSHQGAASTIMAAPSVVAPTSTATTISLSRGSDADRIARAVDGVTHSLRAVTTFAIPLAFDMHLDHFAALPTIDLHRSSDAVGSHSKVAVLRCIIAALALPLSTAADGILHETANDLAIFMNALPPLFFARRCFPQHRSTAFNQGVTPTTSATPSVVTPTIIATTVWLAGSDAKLPLHSFARFGADHEASLHA